MLPHSTGLFMPGPKVSITVPVYACANSMRDAIDNALAQTWSDIEIVVVNDGSRDDGPPSRFPTPNASAPSPSPLAGAFALNAGVGAMTGEVFCWCGDDDMHLPEKTARQVAEWDRLSRPDCMRYADHRLMDAGRKPLTDVRMDHAKPTAKPIYALLRGTVHGCSVSVPHRLFDVVSRFDEGLPTTQDYDLWFRVARRAGDYVAFLDAADLFVRAMEESGATIFYTSYWQYDTVGHRLELVNSGQMSGESAFPAIVTRCSAATPL